ncbi:hypothetical protein ACEWY4_006742 [Coilia grayii]|uniref:Transmembrane protein 212 n=1 Tax=Coilia grayii TaxID=363190 RepID=A0ABD1KEK1_9TELE
MVGALCRVSGCQLGLGITSVVSGILAFFPVGTYKPWYLSWSTRIGAPIWVGLLWELSYTFSILCGITAPLQFAIAVASIVLGPYCYYTFQGAVGTGYLGHAVQLPYPYLGFSGRCLDPSQLEWYHLVLNSTDILTSLAMFTISLVIIVILTHRVLRTGTVNVSCLASCVPVCVCVCVSVCLCVCWGVGVGLLVVDEEVDVCYVSADMHKRKSNGFHALM